MRKHRFKILSLILAVIMVVSPMANVYASESTADQGGGGIGTGLTGSTCTGSRSGWLLYIAGKNDGTLKSDVVLSWTNDAPNLSFQLEDITSKIGGAAYSREYPGIPEKYGPPMRGGSGNGNNVRNRLIQKDAQGVEEWDNLVTELWGEQMIDDMIQNDYALVLEAVYYYTIFIGGKSTGIVFAGTPNTIAKMQSGIGLDPIGDPKINRYTNQNYAQSAMFQADVTMAGMLPPTQRSGKISNAQIQAQAYGLIAIWPMNDSIHTYNGVDSPGNPPETPAGKYNIVKSYHTVNKTTGTDTDDGCYMSKNVTNNVIIDDEPEYKVQNWKVTTSEPVSVPGTDAGWNPPGTVQPENGSGKSTGSTTVKPPSKTVFVQLIREEEEDEELIDGIDYYIRESQISKQVLLSEAETNTDAQNVITDQILIWEMPRLKNTCTGHGYKETTTNDDGTQSQEDRTAYCSGWYISDDSMEFSLKNDDKDNYKTVLANGDGWWEHPKNNGSSSYEYTRTSFDADDIKPAGWDLKMVIHRGLDKLTLAEWKNVGLEPETLTDESDMYAVDNTPQGRRKTQDFTDTFNVTFKTNGGDLITKSKPRTGSGHGTCAEFTATTVFNPVTISPLNVYTYTYSGKPDGGFTNMDCNNEKMIVNGNIKSGVMLPTGTAFSFYPYIEMRFDTLTGKDYPAYVLGQYRRSIAPNDYAEIEWHKADEGNLTLSSRQWSLHASATSGSGWRQKDSVLPGGAVMNLGIKKEDRQRVTVRTYQTILEGDGRIQAEYAGTVQGMTLEDARGYHEAFVQSVADGLDSLCVRQWVNTRWEGDPFDGQAVEPGCSLGSGFDAKDHKAFVDEKYYFRDLGIGSNAQAQEGDLDVRIGDTGESKYTFSSNTKGDILMNGSALFGQGSGAGEISGVAKEINDRTMIVTKLVDAVERNTGNDSEAKNISPRWYNEAFDGVTVVVFTTVIETGMIDPAERAAVLDVKLTPENKGQADLFTKAYVSQFKMNDTSAAYTNKEQIGIFSNMGGMRDVYMSEMELLYTSKKFYIPNVNTQDLK